MILSGPNAILELPSPSWSDSVGQDASVNYRQALDSTRYTYIKAPGTKRLVYEFTNVGRGKLAEIQEFYKLFAGEEIRIKDHNNLNWTAIFEDNSIDFNTEGRAADPGGTIFEQGSVTLNFIGTAG